MNEIEIREDSLSPSAVRARMDYAQALAQSNLLPEAYRKNPPNVLLAIEYGQALGLKPIAALSGISVIKGKPTLSADLMASVVRNAGHKLRIEQKGMAVRATLIRADDPDFSFTSVWDQEKAERAGLWGQRGPWSQYPEQMLRSRAITEVCRQGASDCLYGAVYTPEELQHAEAAPAPQDGAQKVDAAGMNRVLTDWVNRMGGDASDIAAKYKAAGHPLEPEALQAWLTENMTPKIDEEIIDAEIVEDDDE